MERTESEANELKLLFIEDSKETSEVLSQGWPAQQVLRPSQDRYRSAQFIHADSFLGGHPKPASCGHAKPASDEGVTDQR